MRQDAMRLADKKSQDKYNSLIKEEAKLEKDLRDCQFKSLNGKEEQMLDYIKRNWIENKTITYEDLMKVLHFLNTWEDNTFGIWKELSEFKRYRLECGKKVSDWYCSKYFFVYKELPIERRLVRDECLERWIVSYKCSYWVYEASFEWISEEDAKKYMDEKYEECNKNNNKKLKKELHNLINKYL